MPQKTKIYSARFKSPVHINKPGVSQSQHTHLDDSKWDIELIDYTALVIRSKTSSKIIAITPFENCSTLCPIDESEYSSLKDLEEAIATEENESESESAMMEVIPQKKKGRPTYAEVAERRRIAANL